MATESEKKYCAENVEDLTGIAQAFLRKFPTPGVFILDGNMGAGKTTFIKAICHELGITETDSPTFSLVNEYENDSGLCVLHFDLYRIESLQEALDFGFEEYLDRNAYIFIEWPQKVIDVLGDYHTISIKDELGKRNITF